MVKSKILGGDIVAFFNQPSLIIHEKEGNLHNFAYMDNQIIYHYFDKDRGRIKDKIINHMATNDFDGGINSFGEIYLVCKNVDNRVVLLSSHRDYTHSRLIVEAEKKAENLSACVVGDNIHIFYLEPLDKENRKYRLNYCYDLGEGWINQELDIIHKGDVLNPIQSMVVGNKVFLFYYHVISEVEQIFIKSLDLEGGNWSDPIQLTTSKGNKLYLDALIKNNNEIHLTYCEYEEGNLLVKYQRNKIEGIKNQVLIEEIVSNPGNCQYPTLIYFGEILWISWAEYNYIASRYSEDNGDSWGNIYLWKQSKTEDIVRHRYISDGSDYKLNYSFGNAQNLSFIGFGKLELTRIIPIKKRGLDIKVNNEMMTLNNDDNSQLRDKLNKLERDIILLRNQLIIPSEKIKYLEEQIKTLTQDQNIEKSIEEKDLSNIKERLLIIENFLLQNTRGFKHLMKDDN